MIMKYIYKIYTSPQESNKTRSCKEALKSSPLDQERIHRKSFSTHLLPVKKITREKLIGQKITRENKE